MTSVAYATPKAGDSGYEKCFHTIFGIALEHIE